MRLLNSANYTFEEFFDTDIPPYAIVSHRWSDREINHKDFLEQCEVIQNDQTLASYGLIKIVKACEIAKRESLDWIWMDTCCIDKSSSAELSEAINSMHEWYRLSRRCYVLLPDVDATCSCDAAKNSDHQLQTLESGEAPFCVRQFKNSSWFTRSWTLQELLAPSRRLWFFNSDFRCIGKLTDMTQIVSEAANIPPTYIARRDPRTASIAQRMSWASRREASRGEDVAYGLLGLCGVNMPLLYGEGRLRAFLRLQKEIIATSDDESIFCWMYPRWMDAEGLDGGMKVLADSPSQFSTDIEFVPDSEINDSPHNQVTNKGIKFDIALSQKRLDEASDMVASKLGRSGRNSVEFTFILPLSVVAQYRNGQPSKAVALRIKLPQQNYTSGATVQSKRVLHGRRYGQLLVREKPEDLALEGRPPEDQHMLRAPWLGASLGKFEADNYVVHESADGTEVDYAVYMEI